MGHIYGIMLGMKSSIVVIIPAYEPESALLTLVNALRERFEHIVVVDDGSTRAGSVFSAVAAVEGVALLVHPVNRGKGAALKTAFAEVLRRFPDAAGVVTVDADGQHLPDDVAAIAAATAADPDRITLGVRSFDGDVPFRSRLGNTWTRWFFFLLTGTMIRDTQTGLRGIPAKFLRALCDMPGDRYEYEARMLVAAAHMKKKPLQIGIKTVYIEDNRSSHFNPVKDSLRIQATLLAARLSRKTELAR